MKITEIYEWIEREFKPLKLVTPRETIAQFVRNAIRYWNTHSAYRYMEMYDIPGDVSEHIVTVSNRFKQVTRVYPARTTTWIFQDHPLWTLLGLTIIDNVTSDLILLAEAYRNYRIYTGSDFDWTFIPSEDPNSGGRLFLKSIPIGSEKVCVIGTYRVFETDDIKSQYILDWILNYTKALVKINEGNVLRKSQIINVANDGQQLLDEGKQEVKELQDRLAQDARWLTLARRV